MQQRAFFLNLFQTFYGEILHRVWTHRQIGVLIVDKVSDADELVASVGAGEEEGGDADDLLGGDEGGVGGGGLGGRAKEPQDFVSIRIC